MTPVRFGSFLEGIPLKSFSWQIVAALLVTLAGSTAWGQRTQFPTTAPPATQPYPLYPQPLTGTTVPGATLDGTILPADPQWDPYADPSLSAPTLVPDGSIYTQPDGTFAQRGDRLIQKSRFEVTHLHGTSGNDLEVTDVEASFTATFPFLYGVAPLLLTPGLGVHFWDGPDSSAFPGSPDIPARTYDAYLEFGWRPQISPRLSADLAVRPGVYGDFEFFNSDTFRIKARAIGIFNATPQYQIVAGVLYLDRLDVKILPAGGIIWTPNDCTRWEVLFPRPKLSQRLSTVGNTEYWGFIAGEYGGDAWTIQRASGAEDYFDYNDLRVSVGLEWTTLTGYRGLFEVGYVFNRQLIFQSNMPSTADPDDTVFVRGGLTY